MLYIKHKSFFWTEWVSFSSMDLSMVTNHLVLSQDYLLYFSEPFWLCHLHQCLLPGHSNLNSYFPESHPWWQLQDLGYWLRLTLLSPKMPSPSDLSVCQYYQRVQVFQHECRVSQKQELVPWHTATSFWPSQPFLVLVLQPTLEPAASSTRSSCELHSPHSLLATWFGKKWSLWPAVRVLLYPGLDPSSFLWIRPRLSCFSIRLFGQAHIYESSRIDLPASACSFWLRPQWFGLADRIS